METTKVTPGQRFITKGEGFEWVVERIVGAPFPFPHALVCRGNDQTNQKLLALSVLQDPRFFRPLISHPPTKKGRKG
jgi:hypothetical protein